VSTIEIREAITPAVQQIVEAVKETIENTPPELVADLMEDGIALTGGGALLRGLDRRLSQETRFQCYIADDPLTCVVRGTGQVLEDLDRLQKVLVQLQFTRAPRYQGV
jgi:rod shape-determining protein MreB